MSQIIFYSFTSILPFFIAGFVVLGIAMTLLNRATNTSRISRQQVLAIAKAALLGWVFFTLIQLWLAITAPYNPISQWWVAEHAQSVWYRPGRMAIELSQIVLFSIPAMWLLLRIKPSQPVVAILAFLLPAVVAKYQSFLTIDGVLGDWHQWLPRFIFDLTLIPIVYICLFKKEQRRAT